MVKTTTGDDYSHCLQCGKKLGFFSQKFETKNGVLCSHKCYLLYSKNPKKTDTAKQEKCHISIETPEKENGYKCPKCGRKNDLDDDFCEKCGAKLNKREVKEEQKKSQAIAIILAVLLSGAGHMYAGKVGKGLAILGVQLFLILGIGGFGNIVAIALFIWQIIDANKEVENYNQGVSKYSNGGIGTVVSVIIVIFLIILILAYFGVFESQVKEPEVTPIDIKLVPQPESIPESILEVEPKIAEKQPNEILKFQTPLIENLDCSKAENFKKTQIKFGITRSCKSGNFAFLADSLSECNSQGGEYVPGIFYDSYPSLSEYHLQGFRLDFENIGCTKIPINDFRVDVFLYHKNNLIKEQLNNEIESYLNEDDMLYPKDNPMPRIFFKENLIFADPNDYNIKARLVYTPSDKTIVEDEVNFNMVKDYF